MPTEAQVGQFAQTAAAWNHGEPIDLDKARSRLRQHLAKHLGGEAAGDVEEALGITLASVHEMAVGGRSRGGSLASYFGKALAGQLLNTQRRRVEHEAELAAIKGVAEAKVANEVAIGQRRTAAFNAKVANNAAARKQERGNQDNGQPIESDEDRIDRIAMGEEGWAKYVADRDRRRAQNA